jgi:hypothetical protein
LAVFEQTIVVEDPRRPSPAPREDEKGSLQVESKCNVSRIIGTDIYRVAGDERNIVIQSPRFLRLWNIAKNKFLWQRFNRPGKALLLTNDYVICEAGNWFLHERKNGV